MALCTDYLGCAEDHMVLYSQDGALHYSLCTDCGIIWRDASSFHLEAPYNQSYFDSKKYAKNREHKVVKSGWLLDLAANHHHNITDLLEVGCSLGNTLEAAASRGIRHLGIDVSQYAVDYCLQQGLNASTQNLDQLIKQHATYDVIFMQHVLEHFQDPFQVLLQCLQLLKNKGLVVILIPNSNYRRAQRLRDKHKFYSTNGVGTEHYVYFNYRNLERVLNASGFDVVQQNYPLFMPRNDSIGFALNRVGRRFLSLLGLDQELVVIARKS